MGEIILKNLKDIEDFVRGVTLFGVGGGGDPERGKNLLLKNLGSNKKLTWENIDEVEIDWCISVFGMGSSSSKTSEILKEAQKLGLNTEITENPLINAMEELENFTNITADAIVPVELGGGNSTRPLDVAINKNKIYIDGDYAGRAVPEIIQSTPNLFNFKITPIVAVDYYGNITIIKDVVNNLVAEKLGKLIAQAPYGNSGYGSAGESGFLLKCEDVKKAIIKGTLSESYMVGKSIREARENNKDPIDAIIEKTEGYLLFKGKVKNKMWENRDGYMIGYHEIEGIKEFQYNIFKIWFKNENHITWLNNEPYVMSPDLIMVVRLKDGQPIPNNLLKEGDEVAVLGKRANKIFRDENGLRVLGPKHFGFDFNYIPIEKIMEE
jgi:DUF917 family protein